MQVPLKATPNFSEVMYHHTKFYHIVLQPQDRVYSEIALFFSLIKLKCSLVGLVDG